MTTALSLFSGVGGFDVAAAAVGLDVGLATDVDESALSSLAASLGTTTLTGDIDELVASGRLQKAWQLPGGPDVIFGGPPCTPFSHAGFWLDRKRDGTDPAASLLGSFGAAINLFAPTAFVLENVPGLAFKTHRAALDGFRTQMTASGYELTQVTLVASDFGVPQRRRRLFILGTPRGAVLDLSHWPAIPQRSAGEACSDLPDDEETGERLKGPYSELLAKVPPGGNYLHFTERYGCVPPLFKDRGRYWSFLLKIDPEKPSPTIAAQRVTYNGPFHWNSRHLRIHELARLQGFPDSHELTSELQTARRHVGNAVPPAMAAAVLWRTLAAIGLGGDEVPAPLAGFWQRSTPYAEALAYLG